MCQIITYGSVFATQCRLSCDLPHMQMCCERKDRTTRQGLELYGQLLKTVQHRQIDTFIEMHITISFSSRAPPSVCRHLC